MKWNNEKRKLGDLIGYEKNPRKLSEKQKEDLKKSIDKFDLVEVPAINTDNKIIAGHQRIKVLIDKYGLDYEIDVRVPEKKLSAAEYKEYLYRSNKNTGDWDWDIVHLEETDFLLDVGFMDWEVSYADIDPSTFFYEAEPKEETPPLVEENCPHYDKLSKTCKLNKEI